MNNKNIEDGLREVMKHAVAGHEYVTGFNSYCNDAEHALEIMKRNKVWLVVEVDRAEVEAAENEGFALAKN